VASTPSSSSRLTPSALRSLAARHGIRPRKSLGQHFLIEPALARRIVELAEVSPEAGVLEIGAGLGSLTVALAETAAEVVAVELDRALVPPLTEVVGMFENVRVTVQDAVTADWGPLLGDDGRPWVVVANLPYNVAVPVILRLLETEPRVERMLVMVQREVGERLAARPSHRQYGAVSLKVAYRAKAKVLRRVSPTVFWPRPAVESVLVSIVRRSPPVEVDEAALWKVVRRSFEQRRKTLRGALMRLGLDRGEAETVLDSCGVEARARPEELGLTEFACLAERWKAAMSRGADELGP
jgi:16S rRNA (adenine1518-N6/adenine1519-N6)-dimethyltransferase